MTPTDRQLDWLQREWCARSTLVRGRRAPPCKRQLARDFSRRFRSPVSTQWIAAVLRMHFRSYHAEAIGNARAPLLTWAQARFAKRHYRDHPLRTTVDALNRRYHLAVSTRSLRWWLSDHGVTTGGARTGRFPKGTRTNVLDAGTVTASRCRKNPGELRVKTDDVNPYTGAPGRMRPLRHVVWERTHGPVPAGHCIVHLDGDPGNCEIDNLACVRRAVLARLNQSRWRELPPDRDTRRAAVAAAELKQAAYDAARRIAP